MATAPTLTRRLLRTKQAAAYLSMSEWKLRRLIQSGIFPIVQDYEGGPFLLDVRDLDAYIEGNKHHAINATDWRPIPIAVLRHPFADSWSEEGQMSRPRGTGRIYNQKQSSILWIQYYRDGKMHRESTGTADKRKATLILSRRFAELSTGSFTAPDVARIRISELAEDFLRDYRINGRTSIDDAEARWRLHIEPFFGSLRVSAVTSDLLDRYVDRRQIWYPSRNTCVVPSTSEIPHPLSIWSGKDIVIRILAFNA